jgi:hypothetical protein
VALPLDIAAFFRQITRFEEANLQRAALKQRPPSNVHGELFPIPMAYGGTAPSGRPAARRRARPGHELGDACLSRAYAT